MLWKQGRPGSAAFATPQIALAPLSPSRRGSRASRAESRGVALWRAKCPGSGGPGGLHPAGSVQDRLPGCHRGGVRRLPGLHRQPRSTAGCRFKIETLGKSDTTPQSMNGNRCAMGMRNGCFCREPNNWREDSAKSRKRHVLSVRFLVCFSRSQGVRCDKENPLQRRVC